MCGIVDNLNGFANFCERLVGEHVDEAKRHAPIVQYEGVPRCGRRRPALARVWHLVRCNTLT